MRRAARWILVAAVVAGSLSTAQAESAQAEAATSEPAQTPAAQVQSPTVVGTIDARLDGTEQRWYMIELGAADEATLMSSWTRLSPTTYDVTLQGFVEPRFMLERTLAITLSLTDGLPSDCPCRYDGFAASVLYLVGGSMTDRMYVSYEGGRAAVVIDAFDPVGDDAFRVEGSFTASLPYVADPGGPADLDDVVEISGIFSIDRLRRETYEEPAP